MGGRQHSARCVAAIAGIVCSSVLAVSPVARAQTQQQLNWCNGEGGVSADQRINACTAVIRSGRFVGAELAKAYNNRGNGSYSKQDYDSALSDYNQAVRANPDYADAYNSRGNVWRYWQDYDRAIAEYDQAISLNPNYADAYNNRGTAWHEKGDRERAVADYRKAAELGHRDAKQVAVAAVNSKDWERCAANIDDGVSPDLQIGSCTAIIQSGKETDENFGLAFFYRGFTYALKEDFDHAIADYDQAIKLDATDADFFRARAFAYRQKKDFRRAIADYGEALTISPYDAATLLERGSLYLDQLDGHAAVNDFTNAISSNWRDPIAWNYKGNAQSMIREFRQAQNDYSMAIKIDPNYAEAYFNRAGAYLDQKDYERALADYKTAADLGYEAARLEVAKLQLLFRTK